MDLCKSSIFLKISLLLSICILAIVIIHYQNKIGELQKHLKGINNNIIPLEEIYYLDQEYHAYAFVNGDSLSSYEFRSTAWDSKYRRFKKFEIQDSPAKYVPNKIYRIRLVVTEEIKIEDLFGQAKEYYSSFEDKEFMNQQFEFYKRTVNGLINNDAEVDY